MKKTELKIGHVYETVWNHNVLILYVKDGTHVFWIENPTNKGGITPISNLVPTIEWTETPLYLTAKQFLHEHGIVPPTPIVIAVACTCDSHFLFNNGCQCGYLKAQREKVK